MDAIYRSNGHEYKGELLMHPLYELSKRVLDLAISTLALAFLLPIGVVLALAIKLGSKGPVFFRQKRCGRGGREFGMIKFRTMVVNAEEIKKTLANEVDGPMFKVSEDPRITRIGGPLRKWSLDELPQIINIFLGDMSLVGPRPLAAEEMTENMEWRDIRLSVKPGLTGLWQLYGRGTKKFEDWVKYDTEYVRTRSFVLDMKILFKTFGAVLARRGAE